MRFPIYESLYFLNRYIQDLVVILEEIKKAPGIFALMSFQRPEHTPN